MKVTFICIFRRVESASAHHRKIDPFLERDETKLRYNMLMCGVSESRHGRVCDGDPGSRFNDLTVASIYAKLRINKCVEDSMKRKEKIAGYFNFGFL